jgi:hypothetical protein
MLSVFVIFSITILFGCSRGNSVLPDEVTDQNLPTISDAGTTGTSSDRSLLGMWQVDFDVNSMTAKVEPIRSADFHLNILPYIQRPTIYVRSWNPSTETVDVDVSIYNSSVYIGYDVRLIIFNDTIGHKLLNPDNYTHIWDIPGGTWSNGFKAYVKDNPQRCFHSLESASENLHIKCPGGNFSVKFAIDACHPFNCPEPYQITNFHQGTLQAYEGASAEVTIDVFDWQYNTNAVRIQCPAITGETDTYMTKMDLETWGVSLTNNTGAPAGEYFALIAAGSEGTIEQLIHYVSIIVTPENETGWALTWGGDGDEWAKESVIDSDGNIYVASHFDGTVDFDPDPVDEEIYSTQYNGNSATALTKFNRYGDFQWVRIWDTNSSVYVQTVALDSVGDIYIGGRSDQQYKGSFFIKVTPDGDTEWIKSWGRSGGANVLWKIVIDENDNIYACGSFSDVVDFNTDPVLEDIHEGYGYSDCYLCKYDTDGNYAWGKTWGGDGQDSATNMSLDSSGNVYVSGDYEGLTDFNPGISEDWHQSSGWQDCFLVKYAAKGEYLWANTWGGSTMDYVFDSDTDENDNTYVTGSFEGIVDFDPDPVDVEQVIAIGQSGFTSKFGSDGDFEWVFPMMNTDVYSVHADHQGNLYLYGNANQDIDFDPGSGEYLDRECFIAKYDLSQNLNWVSTWSYLRYGDLNTDMYGNIYLTGMFIWLMDFDPGPGEYYLENASSDDAFLLKVLPNGLWEY